MTARLLAYRKRGAARVRLFKLATQRATAEEQAAIGKAIWQLDDAAYVAGQQNILWRLARPRRRGPA